MSLAHIKRSIKVGTLLKLVRHDWLRTIVRGNTGTEIITGPLHIGLVRPVTSINSVGFTLATVEHDGVVKNSHVNWPKSSAIRDTACFGHGGFSTYGFEIDLNGTGKFENVMGYEFVTGENNGPTN